MRGEETANRQDPKPNAVSYLGICYSRARGLDADQRGKVLIRFDSGGSNDDAEQQSWNSALLAIPVVSIVPLDLTIWGRVDSGWHRTSLQ